MGNSEGCKKATKTGAAEVVREAMENDPKLC